MTTAICTVCGQTVPVDHVNHRTGLPMIDTHRSATAARCPGTDRPGRPS